MKTILVILIILSAIFEGCRYEEGPAISFRSVKDRLRGTWTVTEYTSDGIDSLQYYKDSCGCEVKFPNPTSDIERWQLGFTQCYEYKADYDGTVVVFRYSFHKNKKIMSLESPLSSNNDFFKSFGPMLISIDWEILRLTKDDFKISANTNNHNYVVTFNKIN